MPLPARITTESVLADTIAEPSQADVDCVPRQNADVLVLAAAGKMGPSLARRVHRAMTRAGGRHKVVAVSRFSSPAVRAALEADGIATVACDLLDASQIAALPRIPNVLFLAGRKFGT